MFASSPIQQAGPGKWKCGNSLLASNKRNRHEAKISALGIKQDCLLHFQSSVLAQASGGPCKVAVHAMLAQGKRDTSRGRSSQSRASADVRRESSFGVRRKSEALDDVSEGSEADGREEEARGTGSEHSQQLQQQQQQQQQQPSEEGAEQVGVSQQQPQPQGLSRAATLMRASMRASGYRVRCPSCSCAVHVGWEGRGYLELVGTESGAPLLLVRCMGWEGKGCLGLMGTESDAILMLLRDMWEGRGSVLEVPACNGRPDAMSNGSFQKAQQ
eukprot:1136287-Pelagomonas_calceolata.AAC.2